MPQNMSGGLVITSGMKAVSAPGIVCRFRKNSAACQRYMRGWLDRVGMTTHLLIFMISRSGDGMSERQTVAEAGKLAEAAYRSVLADILSGRLRGGTVIQERRLALSVGVSRSPMRDALKRLEGEGLLVRLTERLLTVRVITLEDYLHTLDVRAAVEPQAAATSTQSVTDDELQELERLLATIEASAATSSQHHWPFDDLLHDTIARRSGNPFLAAIIREMRRYTKIFEQQTVPSRVNPGLKDHRQIVAALRERDGEAARKAMAQHIRNVRRGMLDSL